MLNVISKRPKEGDISIDFSLALNVWDFDHSGQNPLSYCMKAADYLVEWDKSLWLIEIKDPESMAIEHDRREVERHNFVEKLKSGRLLKENLGPKAKDSFLYLYLTDLLKKPVKYLALLCISSLDTPLLLTLTERIEKSIGADKISNKNWVNQYFAAVRVFNLLTWNQSFPKCPAIRIGKS